MAKKADDTPQTEYRITYTARPPLADAGRKRVVIAVGKDGKKATTEAIRESHGVVTRVQSRKPGGWVWW